MEYKAFLDIVDCAAEDIESARHYMDVRGVEEHLIVAEYLQNYKAGKVSYREVATALRYDKRIRRILYKYIGYFEERIRAYIANRYSDKTGGLSLTDTVRKKLKKKTLYEALSEISFGQLILQSKHLPEEEKKELFSADSINHKHLDAIIELRNEVSHNRFLLHRKFRPCKNTGYEEHSLRANIINLYNHLPEEIRDSFARELNASSEFSENKWQYQTEWNLIEQIIIKID